jgi:hypothetical protein
MLNNWVSESRRNPPIRLTWNRRRQVRMPSKAMRALSRKWSSCQIHWLRLLSACYYFCLLGQARLRLAPIGAHLITFARIDPVESRSSHQMPSISSRTAVIDLHGWHKLGFVVGSLSSATGSISGLGQSDLACSRLRTRQDEASPKKCLCVEIQAGMQTKAVRVSSARRPLEFQFSVRKSDRIRRTSRFFLLHCGISGSRLDKKKNEEERWDRRTPRKRWQRGYDEGHKRPKERE